MNEEQAITDAFADYEEEEIKDEVAEEVEAGEPEDKEEIAEKAEYSALELEAREDGHTTKAEWKAAGKDPERWKTPHEYVEYGRIKDALDKVKSEQDKKNSEFDTRVENLNKLHKADLESKLSQLKADQRTAVEEADTDAYDKAEAKIEAIKEEVKDEKPKVEAQKTPQEILDWEAKNTWINDNADPRAMMAKGLYKGYIENNPQGSPKELIEYVNKQMNLGEAPTNPRRDAPSETSRVAPAPKPSGKITMSELTQEESQLWNNAGMDLWGGDQKAFLQSVKDSRG